MNSSTLNDEDFVLISVDHTAPPSGSEGDDWYCYKIAQGSNNIVGYRRGSPQAVKEEVALIIVSLNERRSGKRKRPVHLQRSSKPAKKAS